MKWLRLPLLAIVSISYVLSITAATPTARDTNAAVATTYDEPDLPWSLLFYSGATLESNLADIPRLHFKKWGETIYSLELARELAPDNPLRHYLQPLVSTVQVAGNVVYRDDSNGPIYEFDPYLIFRWQNFPWRHYVDNSFGLGWGVSYVTKVPSWEQHDSDNTKRLLNYLMFEATFALPNYPQWQLVLRIHHRSGAFGLYGADNAGSNEIGVGIRYRF